MLKVMQKMHRVLPILVGVFSVSLVLSMGGAVKAEDVDYNVNIAPSLKINITGNNPINLHLNPNSNPYDSEAVDLTVATNNITGYYLTMSTSGNDTNLNRISTADGISGVIPTLATGSSYSSPADFPANKWGYKQDTGNFIPFVSGTQILDSPTATNGDTTTFNFTAIANASIDYIQNLNPALCTTTPTLVMDERDYQEYYIQRLDDGNCWMMDNLNLGAIDLKTNLSSANTNIATPISASDFNNNWRQTVGSQSYTNPMFITITNANSESGSDTDPTTGTKYGTLYNYCAASGGTYCYPDTDTSTHGNAVYDLCPAGWRLPTGGSHGEFQNLYSQSQYNTYAKIRAPYTSGGAAFALGGIFYNNGIRRQNGSGNFWSSTLYSSTQMSILYLNSDNTSVDANTYYQRTSGYSVRCVLKTQTMQSFTSADATAMRTNEVKYLNDARDGKVYSVAKLKDGNVWMTSNLNLAGGTVLSNDLSDVPSANYYTLPTSSNSGFSSDTTAYVFNSNSTDCAASNGCYSYYSWLAATAGGKDSSGTAVASDGVDAAYSICPTGWKLPKSGDQNNTSYPTTTGYKKGDFYRLATAYGANLASSYDEASSIFYNNAGPNTVPNFFSSGYYIGGSYNQAGTAYFWSSSASSSTYAYSFCDNVNHIWSAYRHGRRHGFGVRCIFGN